MLLLLCISDWMVHSMWRSGKDPDSFSIPYLTALGDLLGTALLALSFHFLWVIGDQDSDVGDWGYLWHNGVSSDGNPAFCQPTCHALKPCGNMDAVCCCSLLHFNSLKPHDHLKNYFLLVFFLLTKDIIFHTFRLFLVQILICIVCNKALSYQIACDEEH